MSNLRSQRSKAGTKLQRKRSAKRKSFKNREWKMRKVVLMAVLAASMAVAACNTMSGAGRDVSAAGKAVTSTAEDAKQ